MEEFTAVADRVWVARHAWLDVNVTVVAGDRGLLLVDTLGSVAAAEAMLARLRRVTTARLLRVVNTHAHFDHVLGNAAVRAEHPHVAVVAHEETAAAMPGAVSLAHTEPGAAQVDDDHVREVVESPLVLPDQTFSSVLALDLGDRYVELVHPGRGHTGGDVVVRVPDADVLLAGDLVEQGAPPSYGDDCWPLEWPATLETVWQMTTATTLVVPGHGEVVGQEFLQDQRHDVGVVAETIQQLAGQGASVEDALAHTEWPFPTHALRHAIRRGYEHMPRSARRLPMA